MDLIVKALAPVFMVALAIQMLIETLDPLIDGIFETSRIKAKKARAREMTPSAEKDLLLSEALQDKKNLKGGTLRLVSIVIGMVLAISLGLKVLAPLGLEKIPLWLDVLVTGFCVSGGTESLNSVIKFLSGIKEARSILRQ